MPTSFLQSLLRPERVRLNLQATYKSGIIHELVEVLSGLHLLKDPEAAARCVLEREAAMSTGMEHGIAVPHGKTDTVDNMQVAIGLKPGGIDFRSLDGLPARIFVLVVSPTRNQSAHLRFMAAISKLLRGAETRQALLAASSPEEVITILLNAEEDEE